VQLLGEELELQARYEELEQQAGDMEKFPWDAAQEAAGAAEEGAGVGRTLQERAARLAEAMDRDPGAREESILQADLIAQGISELRERQLAQMQEMAASMEPAGATPEEARQKAGFLAATAEQAARKSEELALMAEAMKRERGMADVERGSQEMGDAEERLPREPGAPQRGRSGRRRAGAQAAGTDRAGPARSVEVTPGDEQGAARGLSQQRGAQGSRSQRSP